MTDHAGEDVHQCTAPSVETEERVTAAEEASHLVGDGYDPEPLLTAGEVSRVLKVPPKSVYNLPIKRIRLGERRLRWRLSDVLEFIDARVEASA